MRAVVAAFVVGFLAARCVPEPAQVACVDEERAVEALARAFSENAVELEDMRRSCFYLPHENLGVVKVRR